MKTIVKALAIVSALAMLFAMAACGAKKESSSSAPAPTAATVSEATKSEATPAEILQGITEALKKVDNYQQQKTAYPDAVFTEKTENNSIVVTISGTDEYDGTYTFPHQDGYLVCSVDPNNMMQGMLSTFLLNAIADYYQINHTVLLGYTQGLRAMGLEDKFLVVEENEDGTGTVKYYVDEKPAMSHLNEMYFTDAALAQHDNDGSSNFTENLGKLSVNAVRFEQGGTLSLAIGEFEGNTDLTYKSIVSFVQHYQPAGYEDFLKEFTELKELSADAYQVTFDQAKSADFTDTQLIDGYKFVFVSFGAAESSVAEDEVAADDVAEDNVVEDDAE